MKESELLIGKINRIADFCHNRPPEFSAIAEEMVLYLCVLLSGYFEKAVEQVVEQAVRKAGKKLSRHRNFKPEELIRYMKKYSPQWERALKAAFDNENEMKDALETLVANRNQIAHGGSIQLTIEEFRKKEKKIYALEELISDIVKKHPVH